MVYWHPQNWLNDGTWEEREFYIGQKDWERFYTRIEVHPRLGLLQRCYAYPSYSYEPYPIVYSWSSPTDDVVLLIGSERYFDKEYKLFQFGVESILPFTGTNWMVLNDDNCYHAWGTTWRYQKAKVCQGDNSYISWVGPYGTVGGLEYTGVDVFFSYAPWVWWQYTGETTVQDGYELWSQSGTVADVVSRPYEVIP